MNIQSGSVCRAIIRLAVESDIPAIKRIANQYKNELGYVMYPAIRESIARHNLVVAEYQGYVVGFVNYRARRDGWQTIYEIAVDKARHGAGIGAGLLAAVPKPIQLKCTVDNAGGNAFYAASGFTNFGVVAGRKRQLNVWRLTR